MSAVPAVRIIPVNPPPAPLLRVFVPGHPVSVNSIYGARGRSAARYERPTARAWREAVAFTVMPWRYAAERERPNLAISCVFIGTKADLDNLLKGTVDGIKEGLAIDDRYVTRIYAEKRDAAEGEKKGAQIEVRELPAPESTKPTTQQRPARKRNKVERSA